MKTNEQRASSPLHFQLLRRGAEVAVPGAAPALTLEDSSVLDDEEFQLHAGRLQQLLHVQPGTGLVLLLHLPGAARGALWDTHLQVSPWRGTGESRHSR